MSEIGYTPKNLLFDDEGRKKLFKGISTIANAVKSTLGPSGQTVLIESPHHTHGITVTKDGVTVAKAVALIDPTEHLAVQMMKEAADRTATAAGDGTTTAIVLTEELVNYGSKLITKDDNKTEVLRELVSETNIIINNLKSKSRKVTDKRLEDIATISANNDKELGRIIAEVYSKVGPNGLVTVDRSQTSETYYESTNGLKIDRGYESALFVNNQKKDECILEDVQILVCDAPIDNLLNIENVLKPIIQEGKKLLIIAPTNANVVNTLAANVMKNSLKLCTIGVPSFGYKSHELMQDIAISVGATYFSEKTGDDLSLMTEKDLGHAAKVIVGRETTVVIKDNVEHDEMINERVAELKDAHAREHNKLNAEFILSRIASLTGGIGVIYVGGQTDLEQKELYDRIDDAVCAVRSALEEGTIPGGGAALYQESFRLYSLENMTVAQNILMQALRAPMIQIWKNAGIGYLGEYEIRGENDDIPFNVGYDVKNKVWGDMYKMGIIDPLKVTKVALQNAVSVASTILSTNAIITMARTYQDQDSV
jgi:chaperonin GroEL